METGHELAHYVIAEPIGKGGMGEVYRAHDTKLGRDVAIKALPEHFADDADRMARFEREARVLASLNHPNIAAVYGLEESDGCHFLVMELVPGESLADKVQRGPLPADGVLRITRQLIDALEAAHESGVVHRDLKPANIQITPDGLVKVLDFGLAKVDAGDAPSTETSLSPTMTRDATQAGIIIGTAPYMSPEQARGLAVDKRTDIFSFGCVVFEMLTGRKTFEGALVSDVMASVIKSEPNWSIVPSSAGGMRRLLERCLDKDPKRRLRDIGDARVELEQPIHAANGVEDTGPVIRRRWAFAMAALGVVAGVIATATLMPRTSSPERRGVVTRFQRELAASGELALSPDGRILANAPETGLWLHPLDSWESREVAGLESNAIRAPFFSPNSEWLGFASMSEAVLYKLSIEGGPPVRIAQIPSTFAGASWTENGTILVGATGGIWEVAEGGGDLRPRLSLPENESAASPVMLPGGNAVLFQHWHDGIESIAVGDLSSGKITTLVPDEARGPRYVPTGHLLFSHEDTLMAVPFDPDTLTLTGDAVPIVEGVGLLPARSLVTRTLFDVSSNGTLVYRTGSYTNFFSSLLAFVDDGGVAALDDVRLTRDLRVSPDGTRLAGDLQVGENDIWVYERARNTMSRLTLEPGEDETPAWSPDGRFIAFASQRGNRKIHRVRSDGSEPPERLWETDHHSHVADWSPDGRWLVLDVNSGNFGVWLLDLEEDSEPRTFIDTRFHESMARVSPDGSAIAYVSDESGQFEVYLQQFPERGERRQVSSGGGTQPVWQPDSGRLIYRSPTHMMEVEVSAGEVSAPVPLVEDTFYGNDEGHHTQYDVLPDGRLVVLVEDDALEESDVNVVVNWFEELEARAPR